MTCERLFPPDQRGNGKLKRGERRSSSEKEEKERESSSVYRPVGKRPVRVYPEGGVSRSRSNPPTLSLSYSLTFSVSLSHTPFQRFVSPLHISLSIYISIYLSLSLSLYPPRSFGAERSIKDNR